MMAVKCLCMVVISYSAWLQDEITVLCERGKSKKTKKKTKKLMMRWLKHKT